MAEHTWFKQKLICGGDADIESITYSEQAVDEFKNKPLLINWGAGTVEQFMLKFHSRSTTQLPPATSPRAFALFLH